MIQDSVDPVIQDSVTVTAPSGTRSHAQLIVVAIALTLCTLSLSLAAWVPLYVKARREGNRTLAQWSMVMIVVMAVAAVPMGMHIWFGTSSQHSP